MSTIRKNDRAEKSTSQVPVVYPNGVPATLKYPSIPAWGLLKSASDDFPDRIACRYYKQKLTYRELWEESLSAAAVLKDLGVQSGDCVGLLLPNLPEYIIALNGIWLAGGVAVAISPLLVTEEVSDLLAATGCRIVVSLDMLAPRLEGDYRPDQTLMVTLCDRLPGLKGLGCVLKRRHDTGRWWYSESPHVKWLNHEMAKRTPNIEPATTSPADTPAYILPTGGTTGNPKAVVLSHRNLVANAWQQLHWAGGRRGEDTFLAVLPFFHSFGLSTCVMTGMAMAATLVLHHHFNARTVLGLIEKHRPTVFHAVPAMLSALNERLRNKPADLSSIRWCISGGAPLPPEVADEFAKHCDGTVVEGFGLSEASPVTHVGPLNGSARRGTIGLPLPDTYARIVDVETGTRALPPQQVGELVVRGPQVMLGYWNDSEETARVIRDGWLYTGDLATYDEDGFFRIVDRKKDLIITSGFNVYPGDVEQVLRQHPDITDAAVIGVPDPQRGEVVKALLVLKSGVQLDQKNLDRFCKQHLAAHKRPRQFAVVDGDLPRNLLGKVLRRHLRSEPTDGHSNNENAVSPKNTRQAAKALV